MVPGVLQNRENVGVAWGLLNNYYLILETALQGTGKTMFKKNEPTDTQLIYIASAWLGISEFQIFSDAWQAWYNEKPSEKRIEVYFINFLGQDAIPFWVRNYVRFIVNRKDLIEKEKRRVIIGTLTYYVPLLIFFVVIMWAYFN